DGELVEGPAGAAAQAPQLRAVAMDLGYRPATRLLVQVIDILGNDVLQEAQLLHPPERHVAGVRRRPRKRLHKLLVAARRAHPLLPPLLRVLQETLVAAHVGLAVLSPAATRHTVWR